MPPRNSRYESLESVCSPRGSYKRRSQSDMDPSPKKLRHESRDSRRSQSRTYKAPSLDTPTYWTKSYPSISWKPKPEPSVPNKMRVHKLPKQTKDEKVKLQTQRSREIQSECTPLYASKEKCKENPSSVCEVNIPSSSHTADNKPPKKLNNYILTPLSISKRKLSMNSELERGVLNNVVRQVGKIVKELLNRYDHYQLMSSLTRNITRKCIKKKIYTEQDIERFLQHYFIISHVDL